MDLTLSVEGVDALLDKIKVIQEAIYASCVVSAHTSMDWVQATAQQILLEELYIPNGGRFRSPNQPITESLLNGFEQFLTESGKQSLLAEVFAVDEKAIWFEFGTNEHWIEPVNADKLRWIDSESGKWHGDAEGHDISGVTALHFMREGLARNRQRIIDIFRENCGNFIREAL